MSVDRFLSATYSKNYTCLHFASDVWESLTGSKLTDEIYSMLNGKVSGGLRREFKRIKKPVSPCIVWFRGVGESHAGVYLRGRVLHLTEVGARFQLVHEAAVGFKEVRYYTCAK